MSVVPSSSARSGMLRASRLGACLENECSGRLSSHVFIRKAFCQRDAGSTLYRYGLVASASRDQLFRKTFCGFSLIEIMIVVSILAIVLATSVPSMLRSLEKEGLRKAQADLVEACSHARAQAILNGVPMELVIRAEGNQVSVEPLRIGPGTKSEAEFQSSEAPVLPKTAPKNFSARMGEEIGIRLLAVNFKDQMESSEARVRFFPNGTCDEFTILFFSPQGERKLSLDVITGLADVEVIR